MEQNGVINDNNPEVQNFKYTRRSEKKGKVTPSL